MPVAAAAVACVWAFLYSKQGCITHLLECPEMRDTLLFSIERCT